MDYVCITDALMMMLVCLSAELSDRSAVTLPFVVVVVMAQVDRV